MLIVSIILLFSVLALCLLALLDRYDMAMIKAQARRQHRRPQKIVYYDAFADRRQQPPVAPAKGQVERRRAA